MRRLAACMIVTVSIIVSAGCGGTDPASRKSERLSVVATTTIVADLVRSIGGDDVEVVSLMGAGVDPHLYKPSAGDVRRMAEARAVFYNGLHLEGKMGEVFEQMGRRGVPALAVAECVPGDRLIGTGGFGGIHDPHVWFDVTLWNDAAGCVRDALVELDPAHEAGFRSRAATYGQQLEDLDAWIREQIATIPEELRILVTAHDAFSYFGRAYGVEVRGLLGISTVAEAGAADVQELAGFIAERGLPAVFVETSVPERYVMALREAVAARGHSVAVGGSLYSDALGGAGTDAATYVGTVRANVTTVVAALGGGQE